MKKFLLFMLGVLLALPGIARDFTYEYEGQTLTYTVISESAKTCKTKERFRGAEGYEPRMSIFFELVIPAIAKDGDTEYSVTAIGRGSLAESFISTVIIPNSVTEIGEYAFNSCDRLTSVTIPNSVTKIGEGAFNDCSELTSVIIPNSVTSIGNNAFGNCSNLKKSAYPSGLNDPFRNGKRIKYPREDAIIEDGFVFGSEKSAIYFAPLSLEGEYVIPGSVNEICENAFYGCSNLTAVVIPNFVTKIGENAFEGSHLRSVIIPNSVTEIGENAFSNCSYLRKSAYPSGLMNPFHAGATIEYPSEGAIIEDGFVFGPEKKSIYFAPFELDGEYVIPNYVTEIGAQAFEDCPFLTSVIIPTSVNKIGAQAFRLCFRLTSVTISNSVTSIKDKTFEGCSRLSWMVIPSSVIYIGENVFSDCRSLRKIACPPGLRNSIGYESYCLRIIYPREGAIIEDGFVFGPEKSAIYFAPLSLEGEYVIPGSVNEICENAFYDCSHLTSVIIPNSVTKIGENAFCYSGLTSVKATAINPPVMDDNSFQGRYNTAALSVPLEATAEYLATNWTLFKDFRIGDSETSGQTYETGNLKYMLIPGKTQEDKNLAVVIPGDYSSLTEVTIPERFTVSENGTNDRYYVDGIGFKAFNRCSNLATVTFNSRNASRLIGDYAFAGTKISALTIPETVESIGNHAFDGCNSLTGIVIPGSVKTIGDYAFYDTPLNKIDLNEGLETIGEYCFSASKSETKIEPIYIPSTLTSVGANAFENLKCPYVNISDLTAWCNIDFGNNSSNPAASSQGLHLNGELIEDLVIPESVHAIKSYAFYYNKGLKSVKFNEALQSIGREAFRFCGDWLFGPGLSTVVIPGNVTAIGEWAFDSSNVKDLTLAYGAEQIEIGRNAFTDLTSLSFDRPFECPALKVINLQSITIGNSVTEIPSAKFKGSYRLSFLTLGNSLTTIGDEAFSDCTSLTEVILPPSVRTIGASAFAGSNNLTSIIMGHNVTTIGEKAYDLCPAQTVSITAQTPPTAPDNTFSNYTGNLYVQGQEAAKAYSDADFCWFQFEGHVMIEPTDLKVEGDKTLSGKPGDTFQLTAKLYPEGVTLPQIFWRSTNPDIATVDANGLVTLHADLSEIMTMAEGDDTSANSCRIIAESLYADGPVAEVTVNNNQSGVDTILDNNDPKEIDFNAPVEVYNLQGVKVATTVDHLSAGIYIVRQGKNVMKMAVK